MIVEVFLLHLNFRVKILKPSKLNFNLTVSSITYERFILILLVTFILSRLLFLWFPFWGFEYEDAYIYADTARFLNSNYDWSIDFYKTQSCIDGNAVFCNQSITFGGHQLTFPILISLVSKIIGYNPQNTHILNFIISCLIGIIIYRVKINDGVKVTSLILLLITPFIGFFQTSGVSEVLSSLFVLSSVIMLLNCKKTTLNITITILIICLAILTKRENFLLIIFFLGYDIFTSKFSRNLVLRTFLVFTLGFVLFWMLGISNVELNEGDDIGKGTFTLEFLFENGVNNLHSFISIEFWGISGVLFLVTIIFHLFKWRDSSINTKALLILILCYFILYSAHYRSAFQVLYDELEPFEALRYQTNIFPLIGIYVGYIFYELIRKTRPIIPVSILTMLLLTFSIYQRVKFSGFEMEERIRPMVNALELSNDGKTFITDLHIIANIYSKSDIQIKDCYTKNIEELLNESKFPIFIFTDSLINISHVEKIRHYPNGKKLFKIAIANENK